MLRRSSRFTSITTLLTVAALVGCGDDEPGLVPSTDVIVNDSFGADTVVENDVDEPDDATDVDIEAPEDVSDSANPDTSEPDADEPDADEPDADEPDADEPDADEPDADEPDADEPDADEPDADEPDAVSPDSSGEGDLACAPGATAPCYDGPEGTEGVGACAAGVSTCLEDGSGFGACEDAITPTNESCLTELDDDCDGEVNEEGEGCVCVPGAESTCYPGPEGTLDVGPCVMGTQVCNALGTGYGECEGAVTPIDEDCATPADEDCDGVENEADAGCVCQPGGAYACYEGPIGTLDVGACAAGQWVCNADGKGYGACEGAVTPVDEDCATPADDDCDGTANEADAACACAPGSVDACYGGPPGTVGVGACAAGQWVCNADGKGYGACEGAVTPVDEDCATAADDDCDGTANEADAGCVCQPGGAYSCYEGPAGTVSVGACAAGQWVCDADGKGYGACEGAVTPVDEDCATPADDDCDGTANEADAGCVCAPGSVDACYDGPAGTLGVGACAAGQWTCNADGKGYGACSGAITPATEDCATPVDDDCDGDINEADAGCVCEPGSVASCYTGPVGSDGVGACNAGVWTCDVSGTFYGACEGEVVPATETCETPIDDDCDGSTFCPGAGESCLRPLYAEDGVLADGVLTFTLASGAASSSEGPFECDSSGSGPDVAIEVTKTSAAVKDGGKLLRVTASSAVTTTGGFVNLAVTSGGCQVGVTDPLKCLWYTQNWSAYIDGDPGTYTIWVAKNSSGTFTGATVTIAEVDPAEGEGEGCFAPYTTASANYTAPDGVDAAHRWTLPAGLRSFDMGTTWGEPGSISCDDTEPYGDIHGADAVIEGVKAQESTVLLVEVQNAGTTGSDLNVELLDQCDPTVPNKVSRACSADADTHTITAKPPVGPFYLWVSTEATGEPFEGATVRVTEFAAALGETRHTAEPLPVSGAVTGTSTSAYDRPSCFGSVDIHWYAVTMTNTAVGLQASTSVPVALLTADGDEVACLTNASTVRFGYRGTPGEVLYVAIPSGQTTTLSVVHDTYEGVSGEGQDLGITFPGSALTDYGMALSGTTLFLGGTAGVFEIALDSGTATARGSADGLTATQLGYDLLFAGGRLFSVDSATGTTTSRLFSIFDGSMWGPTTWDLTPSYPSTSPMHAIATDGTSGFAVTKNTSSATFYQFSLAAPGSLVLLGQNTSLINTSGLAADSQYLYVAATRSGVAGIYRVSRSAISSAPTLLATASIDTTRAPIALDALTAPKTLYARDSEGNILAVSSPASATPIALGAVVTLSTGSDFALTYDYSNGALYFFESESDFAGRIRKLEAP